MATKVGGEVHCGDHHEDDQHELDHGVVKGADAGIAGRKPPQPQGGEGMADGIEPRQAGLIEQHDAQHGDAEVHQPQGLRRVGDARGELGILHRAGRLGLVELHAANPQQGQHGHREHDDPHAAQPVELMPPQVDGGRRMVQIGHDRRARGGEAGHGFEEGVGEAHGVVDQEQGDRGDGRHQRPHGGNQQEAVPGLELAVV
jgi:hypothetical protein